MVVCITGMHRSGTSMVARLLNICGLNLGPDERLMPADEGNPAGYWQNLDMDQLTEDVLAHLAGGWDFLLPPLPKGWEQQADLAPHRKRARALLEARPMAEPWGWKDPRCSLTLPFWKSELPGLKVVVCLRNPVEASRSLAKQVGSSDAFNYNLWLHYHQQIQADTDADERILTHYDMYFADPADELRRVVEWLGWQVSDEQINRACQTISGSLRKHHLTRTDLAAVRVPQTVAETYGALCGQGGPALEEARDNGLIPVLSGRVADEFRLPDTDTSSPAQQKEAEAAFESAQLLVEQGQPKEAARLLAAAVAKHPFHARAQNDLGVLHLTMDNYEQAVNHLGIAVQLDPENADVLKNLAGAYQKVGRTEDAIQTFLDIVHQHPRDVEALYWLGTACAELGQTEQAAKLFARVLDLQPEHSGARAGSTALN